VEGEADDDHLGEALEEKERGGSSSTSKTATQLTRRTYLVPAGRWRFVGFGFARTTVKR
jgi:hypothetical protein